jgi:hypothetical protein
MLTQLSGKIATQKFNYQLCAPQDDFKQITATTTLI